MCGHKFSTPLGKYKEAQLLDHIVGVCLVCLKKKNKQPARLSSKVAFIILHSLQQGMRLPIAPRSCQHFVLSVVRILATLIGQLYLIFLVCISYEHMI